MDEGSTVTLIDAKIAKRIGVEGPCVPLGLTCIKEVETFDSKSQKVNFGISALDSNVVYKITRASTVENLRLFTQTVKEENLRTYKHLSHLPLEYYSNARPSLLIGQDHWDLITAIQTNHISREHPVASLTRLGWVVHGQLPCEKTESFDKRTFAVNDAQRINYDPIIDEELNKLIKFHFTFDSIGVTNFQRKNRLEERAEQLLINTAKHKDDHWEVGLLWKNDRIKLPDNRELALNRLKSLERKMDKDIEYQRKYCAQVEHLIESGYAKKASGLKDDDTRSWYLPHFGVIHPNKPHKIRLVFDGAAKSGGTCLNDNLLTGPDLTNSLLGVLIRFRQRKIAIIGDIREMYLQIKIREEDRGAQKFLWRGTDRCREPDVYVMTSMIFGASSSPYTAQYIMRKNALEFESTHPVAVNAILKKHYVDDYLDSFDNVKEAIDCIKTVTAIQQRGGFEVRNWSSNDSSLLQNLPEASRKERSIELVPEEKMIEKTLGLKWNSLTDTISFDLNEKKITKELAEGIQRPTKREMLRILMSVFDPLGMLSPFTIQGKILLQNVWRSGIGWDEFLKDREFSLWLEWISDLKNMKNHRIPRAYGENGNDQTKYELHLFSDASDKAYAAAAYLRSHHAGGRIDVSFVSGKAKVAPLKPVSIPRMELQGALLATRLADMISKEIEIKIEKRFFWTDSRTVLGWIRSDPRKYQTFVAHRLGEIDEITNVEEWKWISSKQNSADCATKRTGKMSKIMNLWLNGPEFLANEEIDHQNSAWEDIIQPATEMKKEFVAAACVKKSFETPKIENFSKWLCLLRSTALVLATADIWKGKRTKDITAEDLIRSEKYLIKRVQRECFSEEIQTLADKKNVSKSSRLRTLTPFVDDEGILKIGGRINAIKEIPDSAKNPVILDGKHHFTRLLIQHYHERFHHGSTETVVNELRQKYWIIKIRPSIKSTTARCQYCRLNFLKPEQPRMGDLPEARLGSHCRPFTFTGLDYFGPMYVTIGRRREKRWGALFTCLTTRAIHLELVSSLSADSAIMALRRMSNRRGVPAEIFSDNGTNFTGANLELKKAIEEIDSRKLQEGLGNLKIKWQFIAPQTPHMGGSWERLVRSVKKSLSVILNERAPKEEILTTLLTEVENTVNSRPLTNVSVDPHDQEAITPNHLLIGSSSGSAMCGEFSQEDLDCRRQWRIAQRLADMFWGRWVKEYLPNLIVRKCWHNEARNLKVGDIVLIVDSNMPRNTWPRGKIAQAFPGKDGRIRVVEVLSRGKLLKRAANKIVVLVPEDSGTKEQPFRTGRENVTERTN